MRRILCVASAATLLTSVAMAQDSTPKQGEAMPAAPAKTPPGQPAGKDAPTSSTNAAQTMPREDRAAGQVGIRSVETAATMRVTFYNVQAADMRGSKLIGSPVYNLKNENVGEVEDLILDSGKGVKAVVVSVGGFLGLGDRKVAVQPGSVVLTEQADGSARVVINTTKDDLKNAPAFDFAEVDKVGARAGTTGADTTRSPQSPQAGAASK